MARLTLRLPDELYQRLCAAAKRKGISLNQAILESLDQELPPAPVPENETPEERERRLVREAFAEAGILSKMDESKWPPHLHPDNAPKDREAFLASLPKAEKSAAQMISEERDSYGY